MSKYHPIHFNHPLNFHQFNELALNLADKGVKKIFVKGLPATGKSTMARFLAKELNLRHVEVDQLYWIEKKGGPVREDFLIELQKELSGDRWVVEGHGRKIAPIVMRQDVQVIELKLPPRIHWPRLICRDIWQWLRGKRVSSDFLFILRHK